MQAPQRFAITICTSVEMYNPAKGSFTAVARCISTMPCRFDGGDVDLFHCHHRVEDPFGDRGIGMVVPSVRALGVICQDSPHLSFAPAALALFAAVTDDRVPVAVGLFLIFYRDLERERPRCA